MTASAATVEGPARLGLSECLTDEVDESRPARDAIQKARHQAQIGASDRLIRGRIHQATVLSVLAAVQLTWIATLFYGLWLVLT